MCSAYHSWPCTSVYRLFGWQQQNIEDMQTVNDRLTDKRVVVRVVAVSRLIPVTTVVDGSTLSKVIRLMCVFVSHLPPTFLCSPASTHRVLFIQSLVLLASTERTFNNNSRAAKLYELVSISQAARTVLNSLINYEVVLLFTLISLKLLISNISKSKRVTYEIWWGRNSRCSVESVVMFSLYLCVKVKCLFSFLFNSILSHGRHMPLK